MAFKMKGPSLMKMVKEAGMKMKEPMKLKKDSPMDLNKGFDKLPEDVQSKILKKDSPKKKYKSDAQRKAVHASKAESGMKMKKEEPMKMKKGAMKMKGEDKKKLKKAVAKPTTSEIATMKAHNQALKDNPKLYKDSFYDSRREKAAKIKSKYPKYNF